MAVILAIDPGPVNSAWLVYAPSDQEPYSPIRSFAISPNNRLLELLRHDISDEVTTAAIEQIRSYGMSVGAEIFDTVHWAGRFTEALERGRPDRLGVRVVQIPRLAVKQAICHDSRAKDSNIRAALIDRFGGTPAIRKGGVLHGIAKDVWSALAIGVTYAEQLEGER